MGADLNMTEEDLNSVKTEEADKIAENNTLFEGMEADINSTYDTAMKDIGVQDENGNWTEGSWADRQTDIANKNLDFALDTIEQQREKAEKSYIKEQSGAWVDYQKQIDPYGANAEKMASMGMTGTGYAESSRVSMYNTYQNRVAVARESFAQANLDFDNAMREAQLQNDSALAEIYFQAYQQRIELSLSKLTAIQQLRIQKADSERDIRKEYFDRWKTILDQINTQKALEIQEGIIDKGDDGDDVYASIKEEAFEIADKTSSNHSLSRFLEEKIEKGYITPSQADQIYEEYYKLEHTEWKVISDGGVNWFWGIDNNVKVKDKYANSEDAVVYTFKELKEELIKTGMTEAEAKKQILDWQKELDV